MAVKVMRVNGIAVPVETIGDAAAPAVLLVAGTASSMDFWREDLCAALVAGGARVVRYDQRDTGMAPADPPGSPTYGLPDLLDDAIGVLDSLGIASAHWVGFSQGGWVAQLAAIRKPERVASLTLISTRPTGHGPNDPDLPEPSERLLAELADGPPPPDPADRERWIGFLVAGERPLASTRVPFEEDDARVYAAGVATRTRDLLALVSNHQLAPQGSPWRPQLDRIAAPTTVVHGADDPLFPLENGCALARRSRAPSCACCPTSGMSCRPAPARRWRARSSRPSPALASRSRSRHPRSSASSMCRRSTEPRRARAPSTGRAYSPRGRSRVARRWAGSTVRRSTPASIPQSSRRSSGMRSLPIGCWSAPCAPATA